MATTLTKGLTSRDQKVIWHPFTQEATATPPIGIVKGKGAYLYDEDGSAYLDAISSWWVNVHGHAHPHIVKRVQEQVSELEHVIFAGFTHKPAVELAERLLARLPEEQQRVFYSDNGSTAAEVAVKMAIQYWHNQGEERKKLVAFDSGYHGDTVGAMSVSGRSAFNAPFDPYLFDVSFVPTPVEGKEEEAVIALENLLDGEDVAAFIFEPLVQGAAGMVMYPGKVLEKMIEKCRERGVLTIADEVFTGFGRTGKMFATDHISVSPDIYAFSKGLSGGTMALAATTCTEEVYQAFVSEDKMKTFFHGHSYTANPVACAAACASMDLFDDPETWERIGRIGRQHEAFAEKVGESNKGIAEVRTCGTILAVEMVTREQTSYFNSLRDELYRFFLERGMILRPLGNELYVVPPYCISGKDLERVYGTILEFAGGSY